MSDKRVELVREKTHFDRLEEIVLSRKPPCHQTMAVDGLMTNRSKAGTSSFPA